MERVCGCDEGGGGWMRVADFDMTRPNENCPAGFRKVTASGKTMCGGQRRSCISATFSSHGLQYSRVCGKIIGYQFATTDAFQNYGSIDTNFVDGFVLTHGSPRNHIWTFAAGLNQYRTDPSSCPAMVLPTVELYHCTLAMITFVTADIRKTHALRLPT